MKRHYFDMFSEWVDQGIFKFHDDGVDENRVANPNWNGEDDTGHLFPTTLKVNDGSVLYGAYPFFREMSRSDVNATTRWHDSINGIIRIIPTFGHGDHDESIWKAFSRISTFVKYTVWRGRIKHNNRVSSHAVCDIKGFCHSTRTSQQLFPLQLVLAPHLSSNANFCCSMTTTQFTINRWVAIWHVYVDKAGYRRFVAPVGFAVVGGHSAGARAHGCSNH